MTVQVEKKYMNKCRKLKIQKDKSGILANDKYDKWLHMQAER